MIRNKVAESGIITLDLEPFTPRDEKVLLFDLRPFLFREMILKEKDYRTGLQEYDWAPYQDKHVGIVCTADAIIPMWAYMLAASYLRPVAASVHFGDEAVVKKEVMLTGINALESTEYVDKRVILKGCGEIPVPEAAYIAATEKLQPVVKSLMYGEPCSTVPIYKKTVAPKAENV